jgi:DNA-binding CsgD family transcriptional regulator
LIQQTDVIFTLLSPREIETLKYAANGLGDKQIAVATGLQVSTVRTYLDRAREKLSAANRTHAVSMLVAMGLIRVELSHLGLRAKPEIPRQE